MKASRSGVPYNSSKGLDFKPRLGKNRGSFGHADGTEVTSGPAGWPLVTKETPWQSGAFTSGCSSSMTVQI
jgi:hypothetical protein